MASTNVQLTQGVWTEIIPAGDSGQLTFMGGLGDIVTTASVGDPTGTDIAVKDTFDKYPKTVHYPVRSESGIWAMSPSYAATISVDVIITYPYPPHITVQPESATIVSGVSHSLVTDAKHWDSFQWYFNNTAFGEFDSPTAFFNPWTTAGTYFIRYTNKYGSSDSNTVTITLT